MKPNTHPTLNPVVFVDVSNGARFVTRSTMTSDQTEVIDGVVHFVVFLGISSASHPFFTGQKSFVDTEGRIDKFAKRYGSTSPLSRRQKLNAG
ncbi:50S ribosomal protein L31 [Verrucomicrobia bacterium LW23]|nr:50S ribosomal protein L31 [Verrucomicrobia bacterium LW23]